ncbi:hypothetical protein OB955_06875 [Halobacteria archaeon AArc-m2/3/4]|uniref:Uncharacterized protein n=1 Tax=Natronoglomus mannanivorans TaxID=2979990 RepID=A0AAP2YY10_9EURY|nr:hypothetical protein [Halobacteria archaeon AArc-xg1-1]MCU4972460.1 hypothetical protein [Halobacteria archaeon AArc-m2/3/4]
MVLSTVIAVIGAVLVCFGLVGVYSARAIVEKQREEELSTFADGTIDDRTRVRVTRGMAAVFVVLGLAFLVYGLGDVVV